MLHSCCHSLKSDSIPPECSNVPKTLQKLPLLYNRSLRAGCVRTVNTGIGPRAIAALSRRHDCFWSREDAAMGLPALCEYFGC